MSGRAELHGHPCGALPAWWLLGEPGARGHPQAAVSQLPGPLWKPKGSLWGLGLDSPPVSALWHGINGAGSPRLR